MDFIQANLIDPVNKALYTYILVYLLVAVGIYFTIRTRFVQFRYFPRMLKQLVHSRTHDAGISPFQAFCVGLASRVGTGNIAGVAIALTVGGPGAIFWMWVVALIGMATALIEATLGQIFKVRAGDGSFRGGPAFYIQRGLGSRAGGVVFALLLVFAFGFAFNMVQANAIADVLNASYEVEVQYTTIGLVLLAAPVLFGGVRRVARVAEIVLPLMALAYVALALVIIALHINYLPEMFKQIIGGAFGLTEMAGGFTGGIAAAMLNGVKRGLFSNEAGMGSVPNVAATATVSHPVKQGLIQSLGVFVDTMLICTATAFIILVSGPEIYDPSQPTKMAGASLTAAAVASGLGAWTTWLMTLLVFVFAFSSVLGNYVYAEVNLFYLGARNGTITGFRMAVLAGIAIGGLAALDAVWDLADVAMGLMAIVNLTAIVLLGRWALAALRDFARQADQGRDPVFIAEDAGLPGHLDGDIWNRQTAPEKEVSA
ncbi:alanine/glycine:cation symporter family protein [Mycolicibacterium sp.]|uniref:alanine/glycine:cation symporter family protein n=1 Tax=Mycolicibacterium sp. TaxID=2320850 RepID=UPI0025EE68E8|nr:alanine/glycine:cation symporter family protein [Mycolicibacterium sp.]MCB9409817.1 alanine:cation symporter family protein [Mycolicibacterium sp.]